LYGPDILRRSIQANRTRDKDGNDWQYFSQGDYHSKFACWALLFDVLDNCAMLQQHAKQGKICCGINHSIVHHTAGKKKKLDLVIATPRDTAKDMFGGGAKASYTFKSISPSYRIVMSPAEKAALAKLPDIPIAPVGALLLALEAKACMTAHQKAESRLFDELSSSQQTVQGASQHAVTGGLALINTSTTFVSSVSNRGYKLGGAIPTKYSKHNQPAAANYAVGIVNKLPRRSGPGAQGFDAIGIVLLDFANDLGTVSLAKASAGVPVPAHLDYTGAVHRLASDYTSRWSHI
jgi:hypothetical protein